MENKNKTVLILGATGYVGLRLIPKLLEAGWRVRAGARSIEKLKSFDWAHDPRVELVKVDVFNFDELAYACQNIFAAFYLVHSMNPGNKNFEESDREAARNMARAAEEARVSRLLYLGGLGDDAEGLSKHLKSRREVEVILKQGKVPVTVLRAAMIIGSGSASFEILRYLVERLPVMITPRWVSTESQPIAIRNVLGYLTGCLESDATVGETFEIGGAEILTYEALMRIYAEEAGLARRWIIRVPVLTPRLSSYWIHLVTPIHASVARPLAEGLKNKVVCRESRIRKLIPQKILSAREAIRAALDQKWNYLFQGADSGTLIPAEWRNPADPKWSGGMILEDFRSILVNSDLEKAWQPIVKIGGKSGWYYADWLWQLRGWIDRCLGGPGMGHGRLHASVLKEGDMLDCWRVKKCESRAWLLLNAEMKLPGYAILEFRLRDAGDHKIEISQRARFLPRGLFGLMYWYAVYPFHHLIFEGMLKGIARRAQ